jgi:predicted TIM-barrel fold metal-dependent hydrolase
LVEYLKSCSIGGSALVAKRFTILDVDVHHQFPSGAAITPYLPPWSPAPVPDPEYFGRALPHVDGAFRLDAVPPGGGVPGSDPVHTLRDHVDRYEIEHVILSCGSVLGLPRMHDVDRAAALARAVNDWTAQEWLAADGRFLGSVHVSTSDPDLAAAEIRRVGVNPRMVQVSATGFPLPMGDRFFDPIWEACCEVGIPFAWHQGGLRGAEMKPRSFVENHVDMCLPVLSHLASLVLEGVFEKFPKLTVVFNEFGVAWLPFMMWRMDMEYRSGRDELPWLTRLPSAYIAEHVRFSTQPLEEPERRQDLIKLLETIDGDRMLMFSSDYPHWDADSPEYALRGFSDEWKERIFFENARQTFHLDARLSAGPAMAGAA